jgi:glutamate dehydrogenase
MSTSARIRHENAAEKLRAMGVSEKLAHQMSTLLLTRPALDMADLAATYKPDVIEIAKMYAAFNEKLGLYWLHVAAEELEVGGRWHAIARGKLRDEFFLMRRDLAIQVLRMRGKLDLTSAADKWLAERKEPVERFETILEEMKLRSEVDFATLSVAAREFRDLIAT